MKILIYAGADLGHKNHDGSTALHSVVAANEDVDTIALLLDHGADIDSRDGNGYTPTQRAISHGHPKIAEYLLRRGADAHTPCQRGESKLIVACRRGYGTVVELLLNGGADIKEIFLGRPALHSAGDPTIITMLIRHGAVLDETDEETGRTSLSSAAAFGESTSVEALCAAQANPNIQDRLGQTALYLADIRRQPYIVELLLSHAANPCIYDHFGRAPIHWTYNDQHLQAFLHPSHTGGPVCEFYQKERETLHGCIVTILDCIKSCRDLKCQTWPMLGKFWQYANDDGEACTAYEQVLGQGCIHPKLCEEKLTVGRYCPACIHGLSKYFVCCRSPDIYFLTTST